MHWIVWTILAVLGYLLLVALSIYRVNISMYKNNIKIAARYIRGYAQSNGGVFPSSINQARNLIPVVATVGSCRALQDGLPGHEPWVCYYEVGPMRTSFTLTQNNRSGRPHKIIREHIST